MKDFLRPKEAYLVFLQVLAMVMVGFALFSDYSLTHWVWGYFGYFLIFGLGITTTFHRLLAHHSYRVWKPIEYLFALFANLGTTGSSVGWVFVHRMHHAHTETKDDPHSPVAHGRIGAVIGQYGAGFDKWLVRDIVNDGVHRFYHDYYNLLITAYPLLMLAFGFKFFLFGWAVPVFLNTAVSRLSNWIDHEEKFGNTSHKTTDSSRNIWWWSIVAMGEGWHNNHHKNPAEYEFGKGFWQIDVGGAVINLLIKVGLAKPNKEFPEDWRRV